MRLFEEQIIEWVFLRLNELAEDSSPQDPERHYHEFSQSLQKARDHIYRKLDDVKGMQYLDDDDRVSHLSGLLGMVNAAKNHSSRAAGMASGLGLHHDEVTDHEGHREHLQTKADELRKAIGDKKPKPLRGAIGKPSREVQAR